MKPEFEVIVGSIGLVFYGSDEQVANLTFDLYVKQSKHFVGRAAGETVTLFRNGEVERQEIGAVDLEGN
jgi:hypothetical protein